jgi:hypothetical protein
MVLSGENPSEAEVYRTRALIGAQSGLLTDDGLVP